MIGKSYGSYQVTGKLGEGGMGVVYLAKHTTMDRQAVVKVLRSELSQSPEVAQRFINEANAGASIRHPGIVDVMDVGTADDGHLFILMEHLEGQPLSARLRNAPRLPIDRVVSIIRQAAGALSAAHAKGIVHRDLKPDNIFLVPDPEVEGGERAKLLDFGIAKLAGDHPAANMTGTGVMMGTPIYMSPEQCRGAGKVDHRTDLYALGCILFECVCGRPPFVGQGVGDLIASHLKDPPPDLRNYRNDVPPALAELTATLLAKQPEGRIQTADQLVARLAALAPTEPGVAVAVASTLPAPPSVPPAVVSGAAHRSGAPVATTLASAAVAHPTGRTIGTGSGRSKIPIIAAFVVLALAGIGVLFALRSQTPTPPTSAAAPASDEADAAAVERTNPCESGSASDCFEHARAVAVAGDSAAAVGFYRTACEKGGRAACSLLCTTGEGEASAVAADCDRGCDLDDGISCLALAAAIETGRGVEKPTPQAKAAYAKAGIAFELGCESGTAADCAALAELVSDKRVPGGKRKARSLLAKACKLGLAEKCEKRKNGNAVGSVDVKKKEDPPLREQPGFNPDQRPIGPGTVSGNQLDRATIKRVVRRSSRRARLCYETALASSPGLAGTVNVKFTIAPSGRVSSVRTTGLDGSVGPCIRRVFQRMRFPKSGGGPMTINYPFKFKPQ